MTKINLKNKWLVTFPALFFIVVSFMIGFFSHKFSSGCNVNSFKYINLDLVCEKKEVVSKHYYASLKNKLEDYIHSKQSEKKISDVSIYFRDLQNGPTLGIREHDLFSPASLLKLPLLLAYYSFQNDQVPDLFDREIVAKTSWYVPEQMIPPKNAIIMGQSYSIQALLEHMIKYSDNNAYYVLLDYLKEISPDRDLLKETFVNLGIIDPKDFLDNTISVKSYSSIFTQLYNSSYFNQKKTSDDILDLLSQVDWKEGINAGLPKGVVVAHKFGERANLDNNLDQLHDCGIVYYPGNPYLLCVMTRGSDFNELSRTIKDISKMVYDEFDSRRL